tara:strand:- start:5556 stop:6602 length:1047 start_codon:yes stop_codon:yes gene_type:complete
MTNPVFGTYQKINDPDRLDPVQRSVAEIEGRVQGVACTFMTEPVPYYNRADAEKVLESDRRTARITLGVDRPGSRLTGYGGMGHSLCGMIDLVAGPCGPAVRAVTVDSKIRTNQVTVARTVSDPKSRDKALDQFEIEPLYADPHVSLDAARVKIVQKSRMDLDYSLAGGTIGNDYWPRSFVLAKADGIRLVSRDAGIKIITGADERNSLGQGWEAAHPEGIDLIAGNKDTPGTKWELQPLVKGNNLYEFCNTVLDTLNDIYNVIDNIIQTQALYNNALMFHSHATTTPATPTSLSFSALPAGIKVNIDMLMQCTFPCLLGRINLVADSFKYLQPLAPQYILSHHNSTN